MMTATFISGVLSAMFLVAALFFLRFWRDTADRLFVFFSGAFALLAVQRVLLLIYRDIESVYVLRLLAFVLIIAAIVDKNRVAQKSQ
jgi:hypothetical protein